MPVSSPVLIAGMGVTVSLLVAVMVSGHKGKSDHSSTSLSGKDSRSSSRPTRIASGNTRPSSVSQTAPAPPGTSFGKDWARLSASLTPAAAREMLERDRLEETNTEIRAENARLIINQLCLNGYVKEAWDLIELDPGLVRQKSLHGFFRDATLPKSELLGLLDGLEKKERAMGLSGYWDKFAPVEFARLDMTDFPIRSPEEKAAFRQSFEAMIAKAFDPANPEAGRTVRQELLNSAADQVNNRVLTYSDFGKMIQKDPSKDGFAYWDALSRVDPELRKGQDTLKGTDAQVIRAMTTQDPERTLDMTLVEGTPARGKSYVALEHWLTQDYRSAEAWYVRNENKADADSSAVAFMRACATLGHYQTALEWYGRIHSESWQKGIGGEMRAIQRKLDAEAVR